MFILIIIFPFDIISATFEQLEERNVLSTEFYQ